jgi:PAS domain S-box-containing protein
MALLWLAVWQSGKYSHLAQREVAALIDADLDHITRGVYNLVQTEHEAVQEQVNDSLVVARNVLLAAGKVSLSDETVPWKAVNQFDSSSTNIRLPKLLLGGNWLGQNPDPTKPTAVVDEVTRLVGDHATIFQLMNERGDMIRVATTVRANDGQRAIGTYIPAFLPGGATNPVIATIKRGETYRGRAFVVNAWHITAYEPLCDSTGRLVGALYVGFAQKNAESRVRRAILQTLVGKTGYVYVLGGKAEERGRYVVSQDGERDGENIWDSRDSDGRAVIQAIIGRAIALRPGELATERYRWQNPREPTPRWKIVRLAYFEPWDWVIGASVYEDELQTYAGVLNKGRQQMTMTMALAGLAITLCVGLAGILMARSIARPVRQMTQVAEKIIEGDLRQMLEVRSSDEIGVLTRTFNFMTTRLRETLEGLRKSEENYRSLFEDALEGIFRTTLEGRMLIASPGMARLLGYDSASEMERELTDLAHQVYVHAADREAIVATVLKHGFVIGEEVQFVRKDKRTIWVSLNIRSVSDSSGHGRCLQGFAIDVTARRQAEIDRARMEEQFLQAQKMESVGRLAGGVAHDFNNMLQVILGNTALALEGLPPGSPLRESLEEIEKSARRSAELTRQLLTFARKQAANPQVLDFNRTIEGMLKMLQRLIGENIQLLWRPGADLWPVKIDPSQVDQILANLTVNARDAIDQIGRVSIETGNVTFDGAYAATHNECPPGDYVMLAVSDTGRGMDSQVLTHLFEPFFTTKEPGKGTGLGLATVFGILKQNNGFIGVYSEPKQGSTFKLYFPRVDTPSKPGSAEASPLTTKPSACGTETILVVEDEEQILALARRILSQHGYTVLAAQTPDAALNVAARYQGAIHLLIADVVMPGMNGKELRERLTAKLPALKSLFMSGYTADVISYHGILAPEVQFLQKPFTIRTLTAKVRQVLES